MIAIFTDMTEDYLENFVNISTPIWFIHNSIDYSEFDFNRVEENKINIYADYHIRYYPSVNDPYELSDERIHEQPSIKHCYNGEKIKTELFTIDKYVTPTFDISRFIPEYHHRNDKHVWGRKIGENVDYYGMTFNDTSETIRYMEVGCIENEYNKVFLEYYEPCAEEHYAKMPSNTIRIQNIKGIKEAHQEAARRVESRFFYVIDADAIVLDTFKFDFYPDQWNYDTVYVWRSINSVNGLEYGYGGIKLLPTDKVLACNEWRVDFTTSISDKFCPKMEVSNITVINSSAYDAFKSAFRECAKLSANAIKNSISLENNIRLHTWLTVGRDKPFGDIVLKAAKDGKEYGERCANDIEQLNKINDFEWLKEQYEKNYCGDKQE